MRRTLLCGKGTQTLHIAARHVHNKMASTRKEQSSTGGTQRVAQRDGAAVGVDLGAVQAQHVAAEGRLARERLVELEHIDVVDGQARLLQRRGDGDLRRVTRLRSGHAQKCKATTECPDARRECAVCDKQQQHVVSTSLMERLQWYLAHSVQTLVASVLGSAAFEHQNKRRIAKRDETHRGADAHDGRVHADGGEGAEDAQNRQLPAVRLTPRHQQHRARAVAHLRRVWPRVSATLRTDVATAGCCTCKQN